MTKTSVRKSSPTVEDVGYKKPPKSSQFTKGQSGNPRGRPKGSRNFATELSLALNRTITITEHGRRRTLTKREVICQQLANRSASGDLAALRLLLPLLSQTDAPDANARVLSQEQERTIARSLLQALSGLPSKAEAE